ncbi:MAG: response regulator transcription factor, partial [Kiritimatiellia bacterium]
MSKLLVVEDDTDMQFVLTDGLQIEGFAVECVARGREAIAKSLSGGFDLILLDLMLPDISGIEVCKLIRAENRSIPIVILTAKGSEVDKVVGLEVGADDYVTKPFSMRELVARIKAVLRRTGRLYVVECEECTIGDVKVNLRNREVQHGATKISLTGYESNLLRFLIQHRGETVSRSQILEEVWHVRKSTAGDRTVDNYIVRLRSKIESDPTNPEHILTVRGVGYKL